MDRYYIVKCSRDFLKMLLLDKLSNHKFVSKIFFRNTFRGVVLEQVSSGEMDDIYEELIDNDKIYPAPDSTCNND